jgi:hypothetical protein
MAVETRMAVTVAFGGMRDWAWLQESTSERVELYSAVPRVGAFWAAVGSA